MTSGLDISYYDDPKPQEEWRQNWKKGDKPGEWTWTGTIIYYLSLDKADHYEVISLQAPPNDFPSLGRQFLKLRDEEKHEHGQFLKDGIKWLEAELNNSSRPKPMISALLEAIKKEAE